uniref:Uncharacterized protein n=1 Tax=Meloidogyne javanica TaxID=6303 RepID=A0A915N528_MELJA
MQFGAKNEEKSKQQYELPPLPESLPSVPGYDFYQSGNASDYPSQYNPSEEAKNEENKKKQEVELAPLPESLPYPEYSYEASDFYDYGYHSGYGDQTSDFYKSVNISGNPPAFSFHHNLSEEGFGTQQQIPEKHQGWHHGIDTQPHANYQDPQTFGASYPHQYLGQIAGVSQQPDFSQLQYGQHAIHSSYAENPPFRGTRIPHTQQQNSDYDLEAALAASMEGRNLGGINIREPGSTQLGTMTHNTEIAQGQESGSRTGGRSLQGSGSRPGDRSRKGYYLQSKLNDIT